MICELYGKAHQLAKKALRKSVSPNYRMVSIGEEDLDTRGGVKLELPGAFFNETIPAPDVMIKEEVYPIENIVAIDSCKNLESSFKLYRRHRNLKLGIDERRAVDTWMQFVENSKIPVGYRNGGLHYAGYIYEVEEWCLPSWIWTNAALIRMYCRTGQIEKAKELADFVIEKQQVCGGWIVRNDYDENGTVPVLAPNDSAYTANNGCLEVYLTTKEEKYLNSAKRCADWIIRTAKKDGMVYVGYDMKHECWQKGHNIVDVGFTAGLFSRIYEITGEISYKNFLKAFVETYIKLFYIPEKKGFATSLDANDQQLGGMFGRGQAWALEGLIPAYRVLKDAKIKQVIDDTVSTVLNAQSNDGGWAYNISRPFMGVDCKATPVLACSLLEWEKYAKNASILREAAVNAIKWTIKHTASDGKKVGGIFSYTVEGAIVHHMYTNTAFVYASAYAIELEQILKKKI